MDLFDSALHEASGVPDVTAGAPLAVRMRPQVLDDLVGQDDLVAPGSPLRRLIDGSGGASGASSVILWGGPGTGKTTIAYLIARAGARRFVEVSAVSAGVKDVRAVIDDAKRRLGASGEQTVLFVDEVHRFSKSQQDALLPAVENRWVVLVAATTENPAFSVISPLISRSLVITLNELGPDDVRRVVDRALRDRRGLAEAFTLSTEATDALVRMAGADARRSLTLLEAASHAAADAARGEITVADIEAAANKHYSTYDVDDHYDVISAFIKSMRGSDPDAAIHYLARMIDAGEDPRFIARRIMICAAEDVGLADPTILQLAVAAAQTVEKIGMPEGRIPLAEATIAVALAPKSNRAYQAINEALADVRSGKTGAVPTHLRDSHYPGAPRPGTPGAYRYAHDYPHAVVAQDYLPAELADVTYYTPSGRGYEATLTNRLQKVRALQRMR
ncbi:replication-associated recombination protein A [Nanchangia anserum]|uniref:Replication-associated recombination protein A n=1 Tax=Nanchangia anserum TaxID=2692125 RepID=A0A8I0GDA8_9ACTO|nr:replication-associated recombination protein A [Nanchangia anserum]MBD3688767.1 replication-associated recombination protein A [Nanchangia anserum]